MNKEAELLDSPMRTSLCFANQLLMCFQMKFKDQEKCSSQSVGKTLKKKKKADS